MLNDDSDIVITLKSKDGILSSPQTRIYVKQGNEYQQVGSIQSINLKSNCVDYHVELDVTFPLETEMIAQERIASVRKFSSLLTEKGCRITLGQE
jgi:hypothetical protein